MMFLALPLALVVQQVQMEDALRATGLTYKTSGETFDIDFDHENSNRRRVFVSATSTQVGTMRPHLIFSTVLLTRTAPDFATMERVISQTPKQGSYFLFRTDDGGYAIRFGVQVDLSVFPGRFGETDPAVVRLKDAIYFVNQVAEETAVSLRPPG